MNTQTKSVIAKVLLPLLAFALLVLPASLVTALGSQQNPQNGSVGLEGTVPAPPPNSAPTIATPGNGQTVRSIPITVSGLCKTGLLVKVFDNNIFVGAAQCTNSSYSMAADLFSGQNDLIARQYDALDQASPDSNMVSVNFQDAQFEQFGTRVTLTSNYARLGADPGKELDWPIQLSGGIGPYAITVDWGDGTAPDLQSVAFAGPLTIKHIYKSAGIYKVVVKATDANGTAAFLQLVGVGNGKVTQGQSAGGSNASSNGGASGANSFTTIIVWWPMLLLLPLIVCAFWLGRRHEVFAIRKQLEKSRSDVQY